MSGKGGLSVHRYWDGDVAVVVASGRLDAGTYPVLRDALLKSATEMPAAVVADLDDLVVTQTSPLSVFPTVWMAMEKWPGIPLVLACGRELMASMLHGSAVPRFVVTHATVAHAVAASGPPPPRRRAVLALTGGAGEARRTRAWLADVAHPRAARSSGRSYACGS